MAEIIISLMGCCGTRPDNEPLEANKDSVLPAPWLNKAEESAKKDADVTSKPAHSSAKSPANTDPKPAEMADSDTKVIAQRTPYALNVEETKSYYYCTCGRSTAQPFCDGKHKGTKYGPKLFVANKSETVYFCGCKGTKKEPKCDGSHAKLVW